MDDIFVHIHDWIIECVCGYAVIWNCVPKIIRRIIFSKLGKLASQIKWEKKSAARISCDSTSKGKAALPPTNHMFSWTSYAVILNCVSWNASYLHQTGIVRIRLWLAELVETTRICSEAWKLANCKNTEPPLHSIKAAKPVVFSSPLINQLVY